MTVFDAARNEPGAVLDGARRVADAVLDGARRVADAVLFEGYMLYPYRAGDPKNAVRFQFGVLVPPAFAALDPSERSALQAECIVEGPQVHVTVRVRYLQLQQRAVLDAAGTPVDRLDIGDASYLPWDEAVLCEDEVTVSADAQDTAGARVEKPAGSDDEALTAGGAAVGVLRRSRRPLTAQLDARLEALPGPYGVHRLHIALSNDTAWAIPDSGPARSGALPSSLLAAHLLLSVDRGAFISAIDPPEWARGYVESCRQVGVFPVLAGPPGDHSMVLCAPIILYDHPEIAPESEVEFFDATEMDEMLTLRTLTLTDQEKREMRGSDPRAAALIGQLEDLPAEALTRLHGAIRSMTARPTRLDQQAQPVDRPEVPWWDPAVDGAADPLGEVIEINGQRVGPGARVLLNPGVREVLPSGHQAAGRTDAQDMFFAGRFATVQAVLHDVDGGDHLAVSLDELDELGGGSYYQHGRYLYFSPGEVVPVTEARP